MIQLPLEVFKILQQDTGFLIKFSLKVRQLITEKNRKHDESANCVTRKSDVSSIAAITITVKQWPGEICFPQSLLPIGDPTSAPSRHTALKFTQNYNHIERLYIGQA